MFAAFSSTHSQSFKTLTAPVDNNGPVWKAKFEVHTIDPRVDVLSVLVKNPQLLSCPIVGVCVIALKNLIGAGRVDHWLALRKGRIQAGQIRLQLLLEKVENPSISPRPEYSQNQVRSPVPSHQAQTNRETLVEDVYRRIKREKQEREESERRQRRYDDLRAAIREVDGGNEQDRKRKSSSDNQADTFCGALVYDVDQVRFDSEDEEKLMRSEHSERSEGNQSCCSQGSSKRGSRRYQRQSRESCSARSQTLGMERRDLDEDLYGHLPGSDRAYQYYVHGRRWVGTGSS